MGFFDGKDKNPKSTLGKKDTKGFFSSYAQPITPPKITPKPTLGQRAGEVGKELAKGIVKPVLTMVARPGQAIAALAGADAESIDEGTAKLFGDWVAPTPKNYNDLVKDVGYAAQTALTGGLGAVGTGAVGATKAAIAAKTVTPTLARLSALGAVEGGAYGVGQALSEKGTDVTGKDLLISGGIGAGTGAIAPAVISGVSKFIKGKPKIPTVIPEGTIGAEKKVIQEIIPDKKTPAQKHFEYAKSQGYEPYTNPDELPVISADGKKVKQPTISKPEPTIAKSETVAPKINETPQYQESVKQRSAKLAEDPEFKSVSTEGMIRNFDEKLKPKKLDAQIDYAVGRDTNVVDGLPRTAALRLLRLDVVENPGKYSPKQIQRLTSDFASSQAGKDLQATQVVSKAILDNPFDNAALINKQLKDEALKKGATSQTLKRFLDDIEC